jgi:hypothetical protein
MIKIAISARQGSWFVRDSSPCGTCTLFAGFLGLWIVPKLKETTLINFTNLGELVSNSVSNISSCARPRISSKHNPISKLDCHDCCACGVTSMIDLILTLQKIGYAHAGHKIGEEKCY